MSVHVYVRERLFPIQALQTAPLFVSFVVRADEVTQLQEQRVYSGRLTGRRSRSWFVSLF